MENLNSQNSKCFIGSLDNKANKYCRCLRVIYKDIQMKIQVSVKATFYSQGKIEADLSSQTLFIRLNNQQHICLKVPLDLPT